MPIDVIVPAYRGVEELRACIESVLGGTSTSAIELVVVNDASPEPEVHQYLSGLAETGQITLLVNPENLGFIRAVLRAAELHPERDFIILNSDTVVAGDWVDRLRRHLESSPAVATVTPFSNNATLASYPVIGEVNALPSHYDTAKLDALFAEVNVGQSVEIPTGVGSCMVIRRAAWDLVGGFDAAFGHGYGEEVDFCFSLRRQGWKHLLAADVFFYHKGEVSFGAGGARRREVAQKIVDGRYPEFPDVVGRFFREDPLRETRTRVDLARVARAGGPRLLFVSHGWGGGVHKHVTELASGLEATGRGSVFLLQPARGGGLTLRWCNPISDLVFDLPADDLAGLVAALKPFGFQRIHFHHLIGLPQWLLDLPAGLGLPYDVTSHDFMAACPQLHFLAADGQYCGRPDVAGCQRCVGQRPDPWGLGIDRWREVFGEWLGRADRVIAPSSSAAAILTDYFPDVTPRSWPHPETLLQPYHRLAQGSLGWKKIVLLGTLGAAKGLARLRTLIRAVIDQGLPLHFVVMGATEEPLGIPEGAHLSITGQFDEADLPALLALERPDAFLFASVVPETHCYALSQAMATGLPVVGFERGAIGERLAEYPGGHLVPPDVDDAGLLQTLLDLPGSYAVAADVNEPEIPPAVSMAAYLERYLAEIEPQVQPDAPRVEHLLAEREPDPVAGSTDGDQPRAADLQRPIEELLREGLECKKREAREQLVRQAIANQHQLVLAQAAIEREAGEVEHLKGVIDGLKAAHEQHTDNLNERIQEVMTVLQRRDGELAEAENRAAENAQKLHALESSTFWRLTWPARVCVHEVKHLFSRVLKALRKLRRLGTFVRYHYALGGFSGLLASIRRRLGVGGESAPAVSYASSDAFSVPEHIALDTSPDSPALVIVIPSYGEHAVTHRCIASIAAHPPSAPFQVLVADDAFPEPFDVEALGIEGVRVLRQADNLGFLRNCNAAVADCEGEFILLLNNDTVVQDGSLDALVATLEARDDAGAVGAKLVYPDGSLQEAGGIVWRDGSAWNWGRGGDPSDPRFNYVREVDYCSAAALLVRRSTWDALGGFDERYVPAYYEDTDLCFGIKALGQRVLYQPAAVVTHFEGVSHGTDTEAGLKAYQVANQATFRDKWAERLATHNPNGRDPERERDRDARCRILWLEACMLTPDQDSGSLRTVRLLKILVDQGCKVTFAADNLQYQQPYVGQLQQMGVEVLYTPHVPSMADYIKRSGQQYDVITLCRHYIAIKYVDLIRTSCPQAQIWFDTIDLHYLRLRRQHALDGKSTTASMAELAYREEMAVIAASDVTLVVSDVEVAELAREAPDARVAVVSNIHVVAEAGQGRDDRAHVMFVGGFQHPPNIDAVEFYAREIWPLFKARNPDAKTLIIGSKMPDSLKQMGEAAGLEMVGFVEDLDPYYHQCVLAIAPLRYGAGVKGKVNQALSFGLPVVGTPMAVEGMTLTHGEDVMVADDPEAFASAMTNVYTDPELWQQLSVNGQAALAGEFSVEVAAATLAGLLAGVTGAERGKRP